MGDVELLMIVWKEQLMIVWLMDEKLLRLL